MDDPEPPLQPVLEPLAGLVGTWRGEGSGSYPTIEPFRYVEEVRFWHVGKPFLGYEQRTRDARTRLPSHSESGFWRVVHDPTRNGEPRPDGRPAGGASVELVLAHPSGLTEVSVGELVDGRLTLSSLTIARTPTAKEVTEVERRIVLDGDVLSYELWMAAVGQPLLLHLTASLQRA